MDRVESRVRKAMEGMVTNLDKECLRQLQADMYHCSARCCEDVDLTVDEVQRCVERCSSKLNHSHEFIQGEVEKFQGRLQRCVMTCQDSIQDKISNNSSSKEVASFGATVEACAVKCAEDHLNLLPAMTARIVEHVKSL